ncbi:MAG: efflux RND transporter permease subunit, partial [Phycisphaerales bacterium]|nr:efflux RND transporter permease subunit [Phycisphaerales bacterium]
SNRFSRWLLGYERARDRIILDGIVPAYGRLMEASMKFRYVSLSAAIMLFLVTMGMVRGGQVGFEFLSSSDSETLIVNLRMPTGTPINETRQIVERLEQATAPLEEVNSVWTLLGVKSNGGDMLASPSGTSGSHLAQLFVELLPVEVRDEKGMRSSDGVVDAIRERVGQLDGIDRLSFEAIQGGPGGTDITIEVAGKNLEEINQTVSAIEATLARYDGVYDIANDNSDGQREVQIELRSGAAAMGFTVNDVAQQVRAALFGIDAHVFSDRQEDIDVRIRLSEASRRSLHTIENLWISAPDGRQVPLSEIATLTEATGYSTIRRVDRQRTVTVTADTASNISPESIVDSKEFRAELAAIQAESPQTEIKFGGRQKQQAEAFGSLPLGFLAAMVMIYVILAWLFGSYTQPLAVMLGIPFAFIGVVWGHWLMGYKLTFLSMIGFVALSGIVVNDSLILVEFYNAKRAEGLGLIPALAAAGRARLRAIFLTTITTVLGLTPFMLEKSFQAKFLIPMAVAIAFGLMSATVLILLVLPCILVIFDDIQRVAYYAWNGVPRPQPGDVAHSSFDLETE